MFLSQFYSTQPKRQHACVTAMAAASAVASGPSKSAGSSTRGFFLSHLPFSSLKQPRSPDKNIQLLSLIYDALLGGAGAVAVAVDSFP